MHLAPDQIKHYQDKGFLTLRGMYEPEALSRMSAWLDDLAHRTPAAGAEAKYYETSPTTGETQLVRIEHLLAQTNPEMHALVVTPALENALEQLLGDAPVLFKDKANLKPPGCRSDKLHQDQAAGWDRYADYFITVLIAVDANEADNAPVNVLCSGRYAKGFMGEKWTPLTDVDPPYGPADEYTVLELQPGDIVFFDNWVPHGSGPNASDRARRNLFLTFNRAADGDRRDDYYRDKWQTYPPNEEGAARTRESFRV